MLAGSKLLPKRQTKRAKRTRTTTLTDYAAVSSSPRNLRSRVLSPTRRQNPHPLGLNYQSPLKCESKPYAIWKPDFRHIKARFPDLINTLDLTNFSCGPYPLTSPWETDRAGPPEILYSLQSTSRSSFQDPSSYPLGAELGKRKPITRYDHTPDDGLVIGLVPHNLPTIRLKGRNIINTKQGAHEENMENDDMPLSNIAIRTIWRITGLKPIIGGKLN